MVEEPVDGAAQHGDARDDDGTDEEERDEQGRERRGLHDGPRDGPGAGPGLAQMQRPGGERADGPHGGEGQRPGVERRVTRRHPQAHEEQHAADDEGGGSHDPAAPERRVGLGVIARNGGEQGRRDEGPQLGDRIDHARPRAAESAGAAGARRRATARAVRRPEMIAPWMEAVSRWSPHT